MTVRMSDFEQTDYVVGQPYLMMRDEGDSRSGIYKHSAGYVRVFDSLRPNRRSTFMIFIHRGRVYSRDWTTTWGDRTLARLAREFIEEVVGE